MAVQGKRGAWARSASDRFGERPLSAPPPQLTSLASVANAVAMPSTLARQLDLATANRKVVQKEKAESERNRQIKLLRAEALHDEVQRNRAQSAGRHIASVKACRDEKRQTSQEARVMLRQAIDVTSEAVQSEIDRKVRNSKLQAMGRVAAARQRLLESKRASRMAVAADQQFALDEKARRFALARAEHDEQYARKFEACAASKAINSDAAKYLIRGRMPGGSGSLGAAGGGSSASLLAAASAARMLNAGTTSTPSRGLAMGGPHSASAPRLGAFR